MQCRGNNNNDDETAEVHPQGAAQGGGTHPRNSNNQRRGNAFNPCPLCNSNDHMVRDCPHRAEAAAAIRRRLTGEAALAVLGAQNGHDDDVVLTSYEEIILAHSSKLIGKWDLLLDSQSTLCVIVNPKLATEIYDDNKPVTITGMGGSITTNLKARTRNFGNITYCPNGLTNILSFGALKRQGHQIEWFEQDDFFRLTCKSGQIFDFRNRNNLYVCSLRNKTTTSLVTTDDSHDVTAVATVEENRKRFTVRENKQAELARMYAKRMAYASDKDMMDLVGMFGDANFSRHDIARARAIYGNRSVGASVGKTKYSTPVAIKPEYIPRPIQTSQVMHVDIFFILTVPFLISLCEPLGKIQATKLTARTMGVVRAALLTQFAKMWEAGFIIAVLLTDNEGAVYKMSDELRQKGIRVNEAGPGQHVPAIENRVKIVKERFRGICNTLPFELPYIM